MHFFYRIILILWCILIIGNCYHGQNLITPNTDNSDSNIYIYFQILSTTTSVMMAILIASMMCVTYCYSDNWKIDTFLAFVMFPLTVIQIIMFGLIGTNIESAVGYADTKNFKIILSICGGFSAIPVFYSLYEIFKYLFPSASEKAKKNREEELLKHEQNKAHEIQEQKDFQIYQRNERLKLQKEQSDLEKKNLLANQAAEREIYLEKQKQVQEQIEQRRQKQLQDTILERDRLESQAKIENERYESNAKLQAEKIKLMQEAEKEAREATAKTELQKIKQQREDARKKREEEAKIQTEKDNLLKYQNIYEDNTRKLEFDRDQLLRQLELAKLSKHSRQKQQKLVESIENINSQLKSIPILPPVTIRPQAISKITQEDVDDYLSDEDEEPVKQESVEQELIKPKPKPVKQESVKQESVEQELIKPKPEPKPVEQESVEQEKQPIRQQSIKPDPQAQAPSIRQQSIRRQPETPNPTIADVKPVNAKSTIADVISEQDQHEVLAVPRHSTQEEHDRMDRIPVSIPDRIPDSTNAMPPLESGSDSDSQIDINEQRVLPTDAVPVGKLRRKPLGKPRGDPTLYLPHFEHKYPDENEIDINEQRVLPPSTVPRGTVPRGTVPRGTVLPRDKSIDDSELDESDLDDSLESLQDPQTKSAINTCRFMTKASDALKGCSELTKDTRKNYLKTVDMNPKVEKICPENVKMIKLAEASCSSK